ncbi:MAG TPA: hypothetical protein V7792_00485 [Candidatus Azoamicus sp. OHIO2]
MIRQYILYKIFSSKLSRVYINYLFKKKYFYNYNVKIIYPILIPRKHTEELIHILTYITYNNNRVLDLCSGTNIIKMSLLLINKKYKITALDYNHICVYTTTTHNTHHTNIICNITYFLLNIKTYNIISSNPPYICFKNFFLNFSDCKKKKALYAYLKGLYNFYLIINKSYDMLSKNGYIIFEHSYNQSKTIRLILKITGFVNISTLKDMTGLTRLTYAEK